MKHCTPCSSTAWENAKIDRSVFGVGAAVIVYEMLERFTEREPVTRYCGTVIHDFFGRSTKAQKTSCQVTAKRIGHIAGKQKN